jgi:hypothetical protein
MKPEARTERSELTEGKPEPSGKAKGISIFFELKIKPLKVQIV